MGEHKDKNGNVLIVGDIIRIGTNRYSTIHKIKTFVLGENGNDIMARTDAGDFNITLVEKVL